MRRTPAGAVFFQLVDTEQDGQSLSVAARGRVMSDIERRLEETAIGRLRDGVEVRLTGTVEVDSARSQIRLSMLDLDPSFTAGRLATDRTEVLRRLAADGTIGLNGRLPIPLVPLNVGLVTSRGSAAHADFSAQLGRSGLRFRVSTVHASMQGDSSEASIIAGLERLAAEPVDVVVLTRGGGSKLDLAGFDKEGVARAIAAMPVPVITGIGHEIDRSVADEVAALSLKTPTATAEWLTLRVGEYAGRIERASTAIAAEARASDRRAGDRLDGLAAITVSAGETINRQINQIGHLADGIRHHSRAVISSQRRGLDRVGDVLDALGLEATLRRGFAIVTTDDGRAIRSTEAVVAGDELTVRVVDGTFSVTVTR